MTSWARVWPSLSCRNARASSRPPLPVNSDRPTRSMNSASTSITVALENEGSPIISLVRLIASSSVISFSTGPARVAAEVHQQYRDLLSIAESDVGPKGR